MMKTTITTPPMLKAVLSVALVLVNVYFAATSNLLGAVLPWSISWFLVSATFMDAVYLAEKFHTSAYYMIDAEALGLLLVVAFTVFLLARGNAGDGGGAEREARRSAFALLKTFQVVSLVMMILPVEVFLYDRSEFNSYFTSFQYLTGFLPWFSNADLLIASVVILISTTGAIFVLRGRYIHN